MHHTQYSSLKRSGMAHVDEGSHCFMWYIRMFHLRLDYKWNAFTSHLHSITASCSVLISHPV